MLVPTHTKIAQVVLRGHGSDRARAPPRNMEAHQKNHDDAQISLLDELANASVQGLVATGPRRGCRVLRLGATGDDAEASIPSKRCADVAGFNVHANTCARANDRKRLEILVRYLARPPVMTDHVLALPSSVACRFLVIHLEGQPPVPYTMPPPGLPSVLIEAIESLD